MMLSRPVGPENLLTPLDLYANARKAVAASGGQSEWARAIGTTPQAVSDFLNARREPNPAILAALGVRRAVRYLPVHVLRAETPKRERDNHQGNIAPVDG